MSLEVRIALNALTAVAAFCAALFYPYGDNVWSFIALVLWVCNLLAGIWTLVLCRRGTPGRAVLYQLGIFALVVPPYFILTTRQYGDQLVEAQFNGTITKLYRSTNHQYPAIEIHDLSQGVLSIEPLPDATWSALRVGDRIQKESLTTFLTRENDRLPIVEPSVFHAIRGARAN
jgi:hypothetical protein